MTWFQELRNRLDYSREMFGALRVLEAVAPWLVILLLLNAIPGLVPPTLPWHLDFLVGFLIGMGVAWLWVAGMGAMEPGFLGWVRAFAMGLSIAEFLTGTGDFVRGWRSGGAAVNHSGSGAGPAPTTWVDFTTYLLVSLALMVLIRRMAHHRAEAERQKLAAEQARQQALRARLAPHFIFNTLNTLHAQIEVDPKGAQATTERLAALFRTVIEASDCQTIPLRRELDFVEAYLGIEQARLGDRLRVTVEVPEEFESAEVPPLSLQVLVENAIKHGVVPLERGGEIRIGVGRRDGALHLWVEDPGPGFSVQKGTGTALETLRQRLKRPTDLRMERVEGRHRVSFHWRQA